MSELFPHFGELFPLGRVSGGNGARKMAGLACRSSEGQAEEEPFGLFDGIPVGEGVLEFYQLSHVSFLRRR